MCNIEFTYQFLKIAFIRINQKAPVVQRQLTYKFMPTEKRHQLPINFFEKEV